MPSKHPMITGACVAGCGVLSIVMLIVSFDTNNPDQLPNYEAVMRYKEGNYNVNYGKKRCDTSPTKFLRPFRFELTDPNNKDVLGPFSCPWPVLNYEFRGTIAALGLAIALVQAVLKFRSKFAAHLYVSGWLCFFTGIMWFSSATLDANALRNGNDSCEEKFKLKYGTGNQFYYLFNDYYKITCLPGPFVVVALLGFVMSALFVGTAKALWQLRAEQGGFDPMAGETYDRAFPSPSPTFEMSNSASPSSGVSVAEPAAANDSKPDDEPAWLRAGP